MNDVATASHQESDGSKIAYARQLLAHLEAGDDSAADEVLEALGRRRENEMFNEVGRLTRELHDALRNVHVESHLVGLAEHQMPDARERLRYVIAKTEDSAHRTLAVIEALMPLSHRIGRRADQIMSDWTRFTRREMSVEEFRDLCGQLTQFLAEIKSDSDTMHAQLAEALMAQDFQDLTGQVLNRIIELVQQVEDDLVSLIRCTVNSGDGAPADPLGAEGPRVTEKDAGGRVGSQDDVDDLLASLGF